MVRLNDRLDMTVDWDVKLKTKTKGGVVDKTIAL